MLFFGIRMSKLDEYVVDSLMDSHGILTDTKRKAVSVVTMVTVHKNMCLVNKTCDCSEAVNPLLVKNGFTREQAVTVAAEVSKITKTDIDIFR